VQRLLAETDRLTGILDDFMNFVRDRKLTRAPADLNAVVDEVITFAQPEIETRGVDVRTAYGKVPMCRLDVTLFKQALLNLLLNAEEAVAGCETKEIIVRTAPERHGARVEVIDTGRGIREEDREKIFNAFYSTHKGGTGLGLPTTRRIIEEHGGSLTVHSDRGCGTCFTIRLPVATAQDAASTEEQHDRVE
jgi:signal transduction histidine kinase